MEKIKLEILGLSSSQTHTGSFALLLGEESGNRRLPIIIGMFEAQAIAIEMEKIQPNRPMTHDLFKSFASVFNFSVEEIVISDLKEGVFFAKLICNDGIKTVEIDARPSDAIAIGLRFNANIYTYESILSEAGIVLDGIEDEHLNNDAEVKAEDTTPLKEEKQSIDPQEPYKHLTADQLGKMLDEALAKEEYEVAAKLRDELNKRN